VKIVSFAVEIPWVFMESGNERVGVGKEDPVLTSFHHRECLLFYISLRNYIINSIPVLEIQCLVLEMRLSEAGS
jgi:hypothetical protein